MRVEGGWRGGGELTDLLAGLADRRVVLIEDNAHLVHQADLLLVVAAKGLGPGVDVGEQPEDVVRRDALRARRGRRHCVVSQIQSSKKVFGSRRSDSAQQCVVQDGPGVARVRFVCGGNNRRDKPKRM